MTSPAQDAALAQPVVRPVYFVEFQFKGNTSRLSTANWPITWGGFDWAGVGAIGTIGRIEESDSLESRPLNFSIPQAEPAWLALAIGDPSEYKGLPAKVYMCPVDEAFQLIGTPNRCWSGRMDMVTVDFHGDGGGAITLKCETSVYGLKRRAELRVNAAQHKKDHPTDTGLDYLNDLIANPQVWLSARFQRQ